MTVIEKDADAGAEKQRDTESPNPGETPFGRFEEFARRVISVPRGEIEKRERAYRDAKKRAKGEPD